MSTSRTLGALSICVSGALVLGGCGLVNRITGDEPLQRDEYPAEPAEDLDTAGHESLVREARLFLDTGQDARIRLAIDALERTDDYTVLHLGLTFLDQLEGENENLSSPPRLVDPVSGSVYEPMYSQRDGMEYGSQPIDGFYPVYVDAPNKWRFYYPPLPRRATHLTFSGYGVGAMTGVPITDVDEERPEDEVNVYDFDDFNPPDPGTEVTFDNLRPDGDAVYDIISMESFVDSDVASTTRDGDTETISLHSDVTFDFDESTLTDDAEEIVRQASQAIERNIDPDQSEITVIGHTDSKGDDSYNDTLSQERAETVRELLEDELGDEYEFAVEGRGSSEPVAEEGGSDDEEASARNRRVEFSYDVGDEETEGGDGEGLDAAARHVASPAPFREEDGEVVATETHDDVRLDVYPLVRDGAYVITTISLTNTTDAPLELDLEAEDATPAGGPDTFSEGTLGGFQLVEPENDLVRYVAQLKYEYDDEDVYAGFAEEVHTLQEGEDYRVIAVFPAPSQEVEELTLRAGPFGDIEDVPIEH